MNDIEKLAQATKNGFDHLDKRVGTLEKDVKGLKADVKGLESTMNEKFEEVIRHFDVVAENIHQDVAGANRDEISLMKDKHDELEKRVAVVEHKVG